MISPSRPASFRTPRPSQGLVPSLVLSLSTLLLRCGNVSTSPGTRKSQSRCTVFSRTAQGPTDKEDGVAC